MGYKTVPMRLSFRAEGNSWNAYCCKPDTMEGAIWLGSIAMRFIDDNPEHKRKFMDLMKDALGDLLKEITHSEDLKWGDEVEGPEHERTKVT